ncbi:putative membrane protein [Klebsiella phage vB_KpnS-VAC2]|uniref:Membrane protein n=1 Tax=Klebsiella phage vB_KpnS-VAC2 TaxID=2864369 RepID=A0AAE7XGC5_9CAUD|nr:putative membrane protein [Klebsiella phage vB_KpnS-VAC2]
MKLLIVLLTTGLSMTGFGGFVFAIMILTVCGVVDVMHHKAILDIKFHRWASDKKRYFVSEEITAVKNDI